MTTHSSILVWRIPWTEEPGGLQSMGSQRVGQDWVTNIFTFTYGPMDCSSPGSSVHGISQARTLEGVAVSSSRGSSQPRHQIGISCISCFGRQILYHCSIWKALEDWRLVLYLQQQAPNLGQNSSSFASTFLKDRCLEGKIITHKYTTWTCVRF